MEISTETKVNTTTLAVILGLTARRVQQLTQDGVFVAKDRGQYVLSEAIQKYVESRTREKVKSSAEREKILAEVKIKKAKATIATLEAEELQGKMHRSEDVAAMTEDLVFTIRSMLLALPSRLATDVSEVSSPTEAAEVIRKEVFMVLRELSNYRYDPQKYEERVRERRSWDKSQQHFADDVE